MSPRLAIPLIIILAIAVGFFVYPKYWDGALGDFFFKYPTKPFRFGLDLLGGTHLVYEADLSKIDDADKSSSMEGLRDIVERRVNLFGVSEPVIAVNKSGDNWRLVVELAGVKDINEAIRLIGQMPYLEFKEQRTEEESNKIIEAQQSNPTGDAIYQDPYFTTTSLTGRYLDKATLNFDQQTGKPQVLLSFNEEGKQLFAELTRRNVNKILAIYLDGSPISTPVVREEILDGNAQITGDFSVKEAKQLVERLNSGALPVPVTLVSQQSVGASLGQDSLKKSMVAGLVGFILVALFMIIWYRFAGVLAIFALIIYSILTLAVFKLIPVTLTLAGIAGFILSIGMAVDANILIFERMKEEFRRGNNFSFAVDEGFKRAWTSIRDSNVSSLITAFVLYWFGASIVKGFALTLIIGILISMFSAITLTRTFLKAFSGTKLKDVKFLWRH